MSTGYEKERTPPSFLNATGLIRFIESHKVGDVIRFRRTKGGRQMYLRVISATEYEEPRDE